MPNFCQCTLEVMNSGPNVPGFKDLLEVVSGENNDAVFSFNKIIPLPQDDAWFLKRIAHWGTKWDAGWPTVVKDGDVLTYNFSTAWAPPEPVFTKLAELFPQYTFRVWWWEAGMGDIGMEIYHAGKSVLHQPLKPWQYRFLWRVSGILRKRDLRWSAILCGWFIA
jgi:hypothetical protein